MLVVNAVASMEQLAERMPERMSIMNFTAGNRYADYKFL